MIQITAPISPGSSGSPVLNETTGKVIGIATMIRKEGQNLNLAISTETIQHVLHVGPVPDPVAAAYQQAQQYGLEQRAPLTAKDLEDLAAHYSRINPTEPGRSNRQKHRGRL